MIDDPVEITGLEEPFLFALNGLEARIAHIIDPVLRIHGFRLVRIRITAQNGCTLQIMAERADGSMTIEDCARLSKDISPALDVEDPMPQAYHLEVSSPGVDRPLVRESDFLRWAGQTIKLELRETIEGRKRFRGVLLPLTEDKIGIETETEEIWVPVEAVKEASLVLTDELVSRVLREAKSGQTNE